MTALPAQTEFQRELIVLCDPARKIRFVSRSFAEFFGREPDDWHGQRFCPEATQAGGVPQGLHSFKTSARTPKGHAIINWAITMFKTGERLYAGQVAHGQQEPGAAAENAPANSEERSPQSTDRDQSPAPNVAALSHEMRTPLNGILGVLDMLKTTALSPQQERYAKIATSSSEVLLEQVNEALDITRIETGQLQFTALDFSLTDFMQGVIDVFEPLANEKNLALTLEIEPAMRGPYHADAGRIRQILTNLIGNAIKFTEKGRILVRVSGIHGQQTSSLRFEVSDTGIGIPADKQEQVFEDFFAFANTDGRQARSDGLGLSISRRIARAMKGDVSVRSSPGRGTSFVLTLPVKRTEQMQEQTVTTQEKAPLQTQQCKILIVEDNAVNRSVLADMLEAMGHSVQEAVNGADALEKEKAIAFDLIFMDISMPVMDGIEATKRIRSGAGRNLHTHIVGLTAHGREEFRENAVAAGMDQFHTKPIRLDALHSIIAGVTSGQFTKLDVNHFPEALTELIELLGSERVREVAETFLDELHTLINDIRQHGPQNDDLALAEAVHKAKGAAALLGQVGLETDLGTLECQIRSGQTHKMETWADSLDASAIDVRALLDVALDESAEVPL